jgi:hypothetical protein
MSSVSLQFVLLTVAGWMARDQRLVTEYLLAENIVLREQVCGREKAGTQGALRALLALRAPPRRSACRARVMPYDHASCRDGRAGYCSLLQKAMPPSRA